MIIFRIIVIFLIPVLTLIYFSSVMSKNITLEMSGLAAGNEKIDIISKEDNFNQRLSKVLEETAEKSYWWSILTNSPSLSDFLKFNVYFSSNVEVTFLNEGWFEHNIPENKKDIHPVELEDGDGFKKFGFPVACRIGSNESVEVGYKKSKLLIADNNLNEIIDKLQSSILCESLHFSFDGEGQPEFKTNIDSIDFEFQLTFLSKLIIFLLALFAWVNIMQASIFIYEFLFNY